MADVGPVVATRRFTFSDADGGFVGDETYFVVEVDRLKVDDSGRTDMERKVFVEHRWWLAHEIAASDETIYPEGLLELLRNR